MVREARLLLRQAVCQYVAAPFSTALSTIAAATDLDNDTAGGVSAAAASAAGAVARA